MAQTPPPARVLIYSATAGFRHDSIPTAIAALKAKGNAINVEFDSTEDKTRFTVENLSQYDALLFLSTTGESTVDILDNAHPSTSMLPAEWHVRDEMSVQRSDYRA
ncbi:hypothetical protein C0995_008187 [Termitomyces sp. Mi166|nr:hypothetical protein C0995_008187 [Termitomyces sp. Mi166\